LTSHHSNIYCTCIADKPAFSSVRINFIENKVHSLFIGMNFW